MKVWELKEGKEYVEVGFDRRYSIRNSELKYLTNNGIVWNESDKRFKELMEMELIEYIPPIDWSNVEVDTKVLVRDWDGSEWIPRHFAVYKKGRVYTWNNGHTSFTSRDKDDYVPYNQVKLY